MLRPVGKQRVAEEIVDQLRDLILKGSYAVGAKLPPERKLAQELGVNRASLREAIKALEQMGLVKTRQGDGTRVLDFMQTAGVELVSHLIPADGAPNLEVLRDVLEFRRLFGREVARLAAERATDEDRARLEEVAARAAHPEVEGEELLRLDFEFFVALTQTGKNRVLQLLINTIRTAVNSYADFFVMFNPPPSAVRQLHQQLVAAVAARDGARAFALTDEYLRQGAARMLGEAAPPAARGV